MRVSLVAQLVKNLPQCRRPWFNCWVRKIPWRRERLPTPVFLDVPGGSDGEESASNAGDLGSIPGLGRSPGEGNSLPTPVFLPGEFQGQGSLARYSPQGHKESDTTERLLVCEVRILHAGGNPKTNLRKDVRCVLQTHRYT